jgi:heat shock protein HtpX
MPINFGRTAFLLVFLTVILLAMGAAVGGEMGVAIAFMIALVVNGFSYWKSDMIVLRMQGAVQVDAATGGELYAIVTHLAERAALPMPRVYLIKTPQPNAFATGRDPDHAAICASTGLLERLTSEEVAGVLAHELAHVKNRDTLTMTMAATIGGAISMISQYLQVSALFGRRGGGSGVLSWVGALAAMLIAPFAAMLAQMAISRSREYAADRLGAQICGHPDWLASALLKIDAAVKAGVANPNAEAHPAHAHLFIVNPLAGRSGDSWFTTHPAIANRIAELKKLAQEMAVAPSSSTSKPWGDRHRPA